MNKEFIPYEQALELKELGFNEPCYAYYFMYENRLRQEFSNVEFDLETRNDVLEAVSDNPDSPKEYAIAPTFREAFRWFREKHGLVALFEIGTQDFSYDIYNIKENVSELGMSRLYYNSTYEEAELACLKKLIEIVKKK